MKKFLPLIIIIVVAIALSAFWGGAKYAQSKSRSISQANMQRFQQMGGARPSAGSRQAGTAFINGQIIAKDDKSVTIKLRDGGSKIIFYSDKTEIGKFVAGTINDLVVGQNVMVNGTANSDGSVSAASVQIRPTTFQTPGGDSPVMPSQ
ncbi:MAG: hypothetical protein PHV78_02940 [Patescibacteria group bacterium]|nr:hypothetical protein [Patescibacteria group bacterium]MDD5121659.1 hypothetical protein [Patescibacteria group bacterium]MDD5222321.1 hypothetical protein [Patescibacteria group bacterium]MDD5396177.1 hypothetical protein [Patescibacteria group bacterium]